MIQKETILKIFASFDAVQIGTIDSDFKLTYSTFIYLFLIKGRVKVIN